MKKVYVTPRSITQKGHPALENLTNAGLEVVFASPGTQPTEEEQLKILPECIAYLAGIEPISAKVLEIAKNLKVISRNGVGVENIDLNAAKRFGIEVKTAGGANSEGVAELAIALMLCSIRAICSSNNRIKKGEWKREDGIEISGKTLGIIGCGNIGKKVAKMALGLDMKVIAHDIYPDENFRPSSDFKYVTLEEVFEKSDVISLHCPPREKPLIDRTAIDKMKDGVFIVNTARAGLVDKEEMVKALDKGKVRIYATDVYEKEPPEVDMLISNKNTLTTPHIGGYTVESVDRATKAAVDNILSVLQLNLVNISKSKINSVETFLNEKESKSGGLSLVWLGQAGFAIKFNEKLIIIDPYLSNFLAKKYRGKIFSHVRLMDAPISPEKVRTVNYIFCTHAHSDHMDPETISVMSRNNPECKFVVPGAEIEEAIKRGIKKQQIVPANAGQTIKLDDKIRIKVVQASHENFKINEKGEHHFLGYIFQLGDVNIYHSGDCIPYEGLPEMLKNLNVQVALLPVNGRDEYRYSNGIAGNFEIPEVLEICKQAEIKLLVVHHFGMFAYNTVSENELTELSKKSSKTLQIIVPEPYFAYNIKTN